MSLFKFLAVIKVIHIFVGQNTQEFTLRICSFSVCLRGSGKWDLTLREVI